MKKKIITVLIILMITQHSCKEVDKFTQFDMEYTSSITIPSSTIINIPFNVNTPDVQSNSKSTFEGNDTRADLIEEISLTKSVLTITSPSDGNFNFLKSVAIYINAEGLSESKIAWKDNIPNNSEKTLNLETTGSDLKEYIKKDEFTLEVETVTDETIAVDHKIDVYSVFHVDAKILGQ